MRNKARFVTESSAALLALLLTTPEVINATTVNANTENVEEAIIPVSNTDASR